MARKEAFESLRNFNSSLTMQPCQDTLQELDFISNAIQTRAGLGSKSTLSQIAIVLRHTSQSVPLEARFLSRGISYETQGFDSFLLRPEILFMRGWLAYSQGGMDSMVPSTRRRVLQACLILTKAHIEAEGITNANHAQREASTLDSIADDAGLSLSFLQNQVLRNADPSIRRRIEAALHCLAPDAAHQHMKAFLQRLEPENIFHQTMVLGVDIEQALANTQSFLDPRGFMASFDSILAFVRGVNELDLIRNQTQGRRDSRAVQILTIEAAKGLEFEHVIIPGVNRQHYSPSTHENVDCANLLYVGMTRAKNQLSILFDPEQPSAYLQRLRACHQSSDPCVDGTKGAIEAQSADVVVPTLSICNAECALCAVHPKGWRCKEPSGLLQPLPGVHPGLRTAPTAGLFTAPAQGSDD